MTMKKNLLCLGLLLSLNNFFAQQKLNQKVDVEIIKGKTVLTITSVGPDGKEKKEVYKGEEAERKLAELEGGNTPNNKHVEEKEEIKIEVIDGVKTLSIIKNIDGKESVEKFEGEAAEAKMKELGIDDKKSKKKKKK